ncbi:unnamed protein product, partial [Musa textilis]
NVSPCVELSVSTSWVLLPLRHSPQTIQGNPIFWTYLSLVTMYL